MTVREAISDLPAKTNSNEKPLEPQSSFQKLVRWEEKSQKFLQNVTSHDTRNMSVIVNERIRNVPKTFGADWRDIPNKIVQLEDGRMTNILKYPYTDWYSKRPAVCSCATKPKAVSV